MDNVQNCASYINIPSPQPIDHVSDLEFCLNYGKFRHSKPDGEPLPLISAYLTLCYDFTLAPSPVVDWFWVRFWMALECHLLSFLCSHQLILDPDHWRNCNQKWQNNSCSELIACVMLRNYCLPVNNDGLLIGGGRKNLTRLTRARWWRGLCYYVLAM
jgi:hypothetical protein